LTLSFISPLHHFVFGARFTVIFPGGGKSKQGWGHAWPLFFFVDRCFALMENPPFGWGAILGMSRPSCSLPSLGLADGFSQNSLGTEKRRRTFYSVFLRCF